MANTVYNRLEVSGPPAELVALVERLRGPDYDDGDERVLDFRCHVPIPDDLDLGSSSTGLPPSYIWAVDNWGTKWNALYPEIEGDPLSGRVRYDFETANSTPDRFISATSLAVRMPSSPGVGLFAPARTMPESSPGSQPLSPSRPNSPCSRSFLPWSR